MKIGELAQQAGCPVETIRYYEREGLLPPPGRHADNNYRRYDDTHLQRLIFIRRCRALDMTHEEIRSLLTARDQPEASCASINLLIDEHLGHVRQRIEELQALQHELSRLRSQCHAIRSTKECGILQELAQADHSSPHPAGTRHHHLGGCH